MGTRQSSSKQRVPAILDGDDIPSLAKYIKSGSCKNIFLMTGAGISTSSGIPDFRSPDTGLYANLARLKLPYPEAVFDMRYFRSNPVPFYTLAAELYPGRYRPSPTHSFIRLLADRGLLHTCFTQNIDTLERLAGIPLDKIVEAHGSFASQRCIKCREPSPDAHIQEHVHKGTVPYCLNKHCRGIVKPDIVFFGEGLPDEFEKRAPHLADADLLIIIGTSLTVHPFASLRFLVPSTCPRILINLDVVGDLGSRTNDVVLQMSCDDAVRELCDELGKDWRDDLERLWKETEGTFVGLEPKAASPSVSPKESKKAVHDYLEKEVERLTKKLEERMSLEDAKSSKEPPQVEAGKPGTSKETPKKEAEASEKPDKEDPVLVEQTAGKGKEVAGVEKEVSESEVSEKA